MWNWIAKLNELTQLHTPFALVTVTDTGGSSPRNSGTKMLVLEDGEIFGTIGGGQLEKLVIDKAISCIQENKCEKHTFNLSVNAGQCCGGEVEVFIESINNKENLIIFGAGHVGQAVAETMDGTPFKVHLIDERLENEPTLLKKNLGPSIEIHKENWRKSFEATYSKNKKNYIVIMTHSHHFDERILFEILSTKTEKPYQYLGLIGSETKWKRFQKRLLELGITKAQLDTVKCPIGLNVGGKAPKEVAISLAAELLQIFYQKNNK